MHVPNTPGSRHRRRIVWIAAAVVAMLASLLTAAPTAAQTDVVVQVGPGESIQAAIDAADPGTTIVVTGAHVENVWINKSGITLRGQGDASITMPDEPVRTACQGPEGTPAGPATLLCVFPDSATDPPPPEEYLTDVSVIGLRLVDSDWDAVQVLFSNNVRIGRNTIVNPACDGVFVIFATNVQIDRNRVTGADCDGINVLGSTNVRINRNNSSNATFAGIHVGSSQNVVIRANRASRNCIGIVAEESPDDGFGVFEGEVGTSRVRINFNASNGNNSICFPFGPGIPIGVTGILVAGVKGATVYRNSANDNASTDASETAAGILITDAPDDQGGVFATSTAVRVISNRASGNSSDAGDIDIQVDATGRVFHRVNKCGVGDPADIC